MRLQVSSRHRGFFLFLPQRMKKTIQSLPLGGLRSYRGPEFVPLPARGGDEVFSLSRSFWYSMDQQGFNVLVRLRRPGNVRGRVMLSVRRAFAAVDRLEKANAGTRLDPSPRQLQHRPSDTGSNREGGVRTTRPAHSSRRLASRDGSSQRTGEAPTAQKYRRRRIPADGVHDHGSGV
jgi:hypothetical protein